jgi:phosphoglycolate phosphatase
VSDRTALIFDLDGTLIHSAPDIHAAANAVAVPQGIAPYTLDEITGFIGSGVAVLIARMLRARGLPEAGELHARMAADFAARYEGATGLTRPYPGVTAALAALAAAGHRMALCTNKPVDPARAVLAHLGMAAHFPVLVGGDSLPVRKPDPAPLQAAVAALGAARAVFVGDSEVDAETAARAGLPFLLFTEGYRRTPVADLPHAAAFADWAAFPELVARLA